MCAKPIRKADSVLEQKPRSLINLKHPLELVGRALLNCLDPEQRYLPCYDIVIDRDYRAFQTFNAMAHNIGRWWDAILRVEDSVGFEIPQNLEDAMLQNTRLFFDNPDHMCLFPMEGPWHPNTARFFLDFHSMREWLLSLAALVRFRDSEWAADKGHRMLETVRRISKDDDEPWDVRSVERIKIMEEQDLPGSRGSLNRSQLDVGRFIEGLVCFFEATGDSLAMELADRFARYHLEHSTNEDGSLNSYCWVNHTHSYFGTLRGLLRFGQVTGKQEYIERVDATYRETVRGLFKPSGYICHDLDKETGGDSAACGDAMQLAIWLSYLGPSTLAAERQDYLLDDAERMMRNRLLPSQVTECPPLLPLELKKSVDGKSYLVWNNVSHTEREIPVEAISWKEDSAERVTGAFSIHHEPHGGKHAVTDVTAAVAHSLCDFYNHIVGESAAGLVIRFHTNFENEQVAISSSRDSEAALDIRVKASQPVMVRIPGWAPEESVLFKVNDAVRQAERLGSFARFGAENFPGTIRLQHALPSRRSRDVINGTEFEYAWRGDEIVGVSPNTDHFPFYPTLT